MIHEIIDNYGYWNGQVGGTRSAFEDNGEKVAGHGNNVWAYNTIDGSTALRNIVENNYCDSNNAARTIFIVSSAANNSVRANKLIGSSATVFLNGDVGSGNIISPNHLNNVIRYLVEKSPGAQTVGTSQATIAHGLGYTPTVVIIMMTSTGMIWKSAAAELLVR